MLAPAPEQLSTTIENRAGFWRRWCASLRLSGLYPLSHHEIAVRLAEPTSEVDAGHSSLDWLSQDP
jgi:hypothetical protein